MLKFFKFSWKTSLIGAVLIVCMLRLSFWQWQRHLEKQIYIADLEQRVNQPVVPLADQLNEIFENPDSFVNRRFSLSGEYDFAHEIYIRNRSLGGNPGTLAITPLKMDGVRHAILISRGFIALKDSTPEIRKLYQNEVDDQIVAILKPAVPRRMFAPQDPETGQDKAWVSDFLRLDIAHIEKQMPYPLAPFFLELIPQISPEQMSTEIVKGSSKKEELLLLPLRGFDEKEVLPPNDSAIRQPTRLLSTVMPTVRHLGYVFEWATMALMTFLVCLVLQFKR